MATLALNLFTSWDLTTKEYLIGSILQLAQQQVIQNQIALLAEEKDALLLDPEHPLLFMQAEAEKRGQIASLRYLLDSSDAAEIQLNDPETDLEL